MSIKTVTGTVVTTGTAGSAAGATTVTIDGYIEWIYLDWSASAAATTDLTVACAGNPPGGTIFATTNSTTDALYFPRAKAVDNANAAITDSHTRFAVNGSVTFTIAQGDALSPCLTFYVGVAS